MKSKTTVGLIVILLLAAGYMVIRHGGLLREPQPQQAPQPQPLNVPPAGQIRRVEVLSVAGETAGTVLTLARGDGAWQVREPYRAPARAYQVENLLRGLRRGRLQPLDGPQAPAAAEAGLEPPRWRVLIDAVDGRTLSLAVGDPVPLTGGRQTYVRLGEGTVMRFDGDLASLLGRPAGEYRDRTVLDAPARDVLAVEIRGPALLSVRRASPEAPWRLGEPIEAAADADAVEDLLEELLPLEAERFLPAAPDGQLSARGLKPGNERMRVTLTLLGEEPTVQPTPDAAESLPRPRRKIELAIGQETADRRHVYARRLDREGLFLLTVDRVEALTPSVDSLRSDRVFDAATDAVETIEISLPGQKTLLRRNAPDAAAGWRMLEPVAGDAEDAQVRAFLDDLTGLRADQWAETTADPAVLGLQPPVGEIVLAGENTRRTLQIGRESASGLLRYVRDAAGEHIALVAAGRIAELGARPQRFWPRTLLEIPDEEPIERIQIDQPDGRFTLTPDQAGGWRLELPDRAEPLEADPRNVENLIEALRDLRADSIEQLDTMVPNAYLEDPTRVTVAVTVGGESPDTQPATTPATSTAPATAPAARTYIVQAVRTDTAAYAWRRDSPVAAIGRFEPKLYKTLRAELRGRRIWTLDPDRVTTVEIDRGEGPFRLVRREGDWLCESDPAVKIDPAKVREYLAVAGELTARRYYTPPKMPAGEDPFGFSPPLLELAFTLEGRNEPVTLSVAREGLEKNESRFARSSESPKMFLLSAGRLEALDRRLREFSE